MSVTPIVIENDKFRLEIDKDSSAKSLVIKSNGRECLQQGVKLPLFSITELRPYNNEIKLAYPNTKREYFSNGVTIKDDILTISFELLTFKAMVKIITCPTYVEFKLLDFTMDEKVNVDLFMDYPPVEEFRILQLPIKNLDNFGDWLNVMHDDDIAINVLGSSPHPSIGSTKQNDYTIMYADARRGIKLKGCSAILIATEKDNLLDVIDRVEQDYNLPRGVRSRRSNDINRSILWSWQVNRKTIDKYIDFAKKGGFTKMLLYYGNFFEMDEMQAYLLNNSFVYNENYANKEEDVKYILGRLEQAGIDAGLHVLHTHIGMRTKYLTPEVDHRINIKERYTLSKPLTKTDDKVYVEESTEWAPMHDGCRILTFNGELMQYEGYTTEYPYYFYGVKRGFNDTYVKESPVGLSGGVVDISEYGAISAYVNQNSDLQDEIADGLSKIFNLGFKFVYFDGSEGTNAPFDFHIANAQYRVYKKLTNPPLFCEGAAKTHFGWHMLSGGNAFDVFPTKVFKEKIAEFPLEEAGRMAKDFTRINFGWWHLYDDIQPDHYEYGSSKAFSHDCPITLQLPYKEMSARSDDVLEVLRRWEDARKKGFITAEQKELLKNPDKEYILLINEQGEYELTEYEEIKLGEECPVKAFSFTRNEKAYVVYWHKQLKCNIELPLDINGVIVEEELGGEKVQISMIDDKLIIPAENRRYLSANVPVQTLVQAFMKAEFKD